MKKNKIEYITNESGDWCVLKLNGEVFDEGHSISGHSWVELLRELNFTVDEIELSDDKF